MNRLLRIIYFGGILLWTSYEVLFPSWVGRFYNYETYGDSPEWHVGGLFGLKRGAGFTKRAPLWNPPTAHSNAIHPSTRWPWQSPNQHEHVEIHLGRTIIGCSGSLLLFGLVVCGLNRWKPVEQPNALLTIAWSVSLALVIAWVLIIVLAAFSMGYAATDPVVIIILSLGTLAGLIHGVASFARKQSRELKQ